MTIDSTIFYTNKITAIQYSGYFHSEIRKLFDAGKVREDNEELRVQRILEEERKRVQEVYGSRGKTVKQNEPYDNLKRFEETMELVKRYPVKPAIRLQPPKPYEVNEPGRFIDKLV